MVSPDNEVQMDWLNKYVRYDEVFNKETKISDIVIIILNLHLLPVSNTTENRWKDDTWKWCSPAWTSSKYQARDQGGRDRRSLSILKRPFYLLLWFDVCFPHDMSLRVLTVLLSGAINVHERIIYNKTKETSRDSDGLVFLPPLVDWVYIILEYADRFGYQIDPSVIARINSRRMDYIRRFSNSFF